MPARSQPAIAAIPTGQSNHDLTFKIATLKTPRDGEPKVETYTLDQLVQLVSNAPTSKTRFDAYHFQKSELKRLSAEAKAVQDAGDIQTAKSLKVNSKRYKDALDGTKFGPAIMPFIFEDDITFNVDEGGRKHRDKDRITHFSLVMLDIESNTSQDEIHAALRDYEYLLWPTISHTKKDPRYRVVLFPQSPLVIPEAKALIHRIDAHLPDRNDLKKKTQNIDPVSDEVGRLMFLPQWLIGHPEKYAIVHNHGKLLTPDSFAVTAEVQAAIDSRRRVAEEQREREKTESITRHRSVTLTDSGNALITVNGKDWLNPDYTFETDDGYVQLKDATTKIGGVRCPFHNDAVGSEFIAPNKHSGRPQLVCAKCGTFKMLPYDTAWLVPEMDSSEFAALVQKVKSSKSSSTTRTAKKSGNLGEETVPPDLHTFNSRFLPDIHPLLPDQGILFVRSPKGTGKTKALYKVVQKARDKKRSVVLLTHRRSLAKNLSERLGLHNYQDLEDGSSISDFAVVCVNSLTSRLDEAAAQYDIVIIDESEQVLRNLLASTLKENLSDVFNKILLLLSNALQVICLDADLSSDMTIELITLMRNSAGEKIRDHYIGIINDYKIGAGKVIRYLPNQYQLLAEISAAAEAGQKIFVASSTARAATAIGEMLKAQGKNVLVITAQTSSDEAVRYFQAHPNKVLAPIKVEDDEAVPQSHLLEIDEDPPQINDVTQNDAVNHYDAVIASPSLQTGFSIDIPYFDKVFGWFQSVEGITYQDYDQALSRVRHCDDVTVWVQKTSLPSNIEPPQAFIQKAKSRELKTRKRLPGEPTALSDGEQLWIRIEGLIQYLTANWCSQRDAKFKAMKKDLGFTPAEVAKDEDQESVGRDLWSSFKDAGPDYAQKILDAPELNDDEGIALSRKQNKTNEDHFALRRHQIAKYVKEDLTLSLVEKAIKEDIGRVVSRVKALIIDGDATRVGRDKKSRERHHTAFTRASHYTFKHELLVKHLCKVGDLDLQQLYERIEVGEEVMISTELLDRLLDAYAERQADFAHVFDLRIKSIEGAVNSEKRKAEYKELPWTAEDEAAAKVKAKQQRRKHIWNGTFGTLGLPLKKKKRGPRGKQVATYFIDNKAVDLTIKAIREQQRMHERMSIVIQKAKTRS